MKNILIPIDSKFNSYDVIDYAVQFFKSEKCIFYFLNTYTNTVDEFEALSVLKEDDDMFDAAKRDSEFCLGNFIKNYTSKSSNDNHRFNAVSECCNLIDGIKKTIKILNIDVVVLAGKEQANKNRDKYSKNTKRIIENIRECPVMVIPVSAHLQKLPNFVLVSSFDKDLSKSELENWYGLVKIANGKMKIITLSGKEEMTDLQKNNQSRTRFHLEMLSDKKIPVEYIENALTLKDFAKYHSDYIICLMDSKPDFWRMCGLKHSQITKLGPLENTPLIALHN